jgi:hypothetical protein
MAAPTIPGPSTQAVNTVGSTQNFTVQWWNFFNGLLAYLTTGPLAPSTPTDQSGAGLVFTGASTFSQEISGFIFVTGTVTYPANASGSAATISLPVPVPNHPYAQGVGSYISIGFDGGFVVAIPGTSTATFDDTSGAAHSNAHFSGKTISYSLFYPAA